uniref:HTH_Tnp_Tc3_2 domain-containing protein n=1 Tax=Caenorhabditis japonica TaxID=281687 RepID=A0A8R1DGG1_CAEJA
MDRNILRTCQEDPRRTSTDIQVSVTSPNKPVPSRRTIRRRLQVAGLHGRRPVKKPLICSSLPMPDGKTWRWICDGLGMLLRHFDGLIEENCWNHGPICVRRHPVEHNVTMGSCRQLVSTSPCGSPGMAKSVPGLLSFEYMWEELERHLKGVRASNANQKFVQLEAAWKSIPMTVVQTLLYSMPRRCQAVIDAKGYPTKY